MTGKKLQSTEKELKAKKERLVDIEDNFEELSQVFRRELDKAVKFRKATFLMGASPEMCIAVWTSILANLLRLELD